MITGDVPMGARPGDAAAPHPAGDAGQRRQPAQSDSGRAGKGLRLLPEQARQRVLPVAVTPDELGEAWDGGKVHLPLVVHINGQLFGEPNAGDDMTFDFAQLIAHAAQDARARARAPSSARARSRT